MIASKEDLKRYLNSDKKALFIKNRNKPKMIGDDIWKFQILLRKLEYYTNCKKGLFSKLCYLLIKYRYNRMSIKLGITIPPNVFDEGLSIAHIGTIVVSSGAKVGKFCRVHTCVNIGTAAWKQFEAPTIGDNVYIGPGAKIFGKISIPDNIQIGANAVVSKSFENPGVILLGVPAREVPAKEVYDMRK